MTWRTRIGSWSLKGETVRDMKRWQVAIGFGGVILLVVGGMAGDNIPMALVGLGLIAVFRIGIKNEGGVW